MIVPRFPLVHLSQRGVEWLLRSTTIMVKSTWFIFPAGMPACLQQTVCTDRDAQGQLVWAQSRHMDKQSYGTLRWQVHGWHYSECAAAYSIDMHVAHRDWCTTVGVLRAMYTGQPFALSTRTHLAGPSFEWYMRKIQHKREDGTIEPVLGTIPTCSQCRTIFDEAWAAQVPKYGDYPTDVVRGRLSGWKKIEKPKGTTHVDVSAEQLKALEEMHK